MDFPIIIVWVSPLQFLGALSVIFKFYSIFRWKFSKQTEYPQMGRRVLRRHIWGYSVCLCPIKGMPGLKWAKYTLLF